MNEITYLYKKGVGWVPSTDCQYFTVQTQNGSLWLLEVRIPQVDEIFSWAYPNEPGVNADLTFDPDWWVEEALKWHDVQTWGKASLGDIKRAQDYAGRRIYYTLIPIDTPT